MSNTTHNSEELRQTFESLPTVDSSRSDLRVINFEVLTSIVENATRKASLAAGVESLTRANDIVKEVFSKSFPSL
jgi:predicted regulator of amino acid metabolism with ACT domain